MNSMQRVVSKMYGQYVTPVDRALLDMVFAEKPTQALLDDCLRVCDIEVMGGHKSLMFSYLMREHPELRFSAYVAPRLKGLVNFYRFANIQVLQHFSRIGKALNESGIPILIYKGAAMKTLRPELSRPMGDVDILIPQERMKEAINLCEKLGYRYAMEGDEHHTATIRTVDGKDAVDIHCAIFGAEYVGSAATTNFNKHLFARAKECSAFGVRVLLPAHEDLFFIVLANLTKNLREKTSLHSLFYALFDCRFLLRDKPSFDWGIVRNNSQVTHMELQVRLAVEFMDALVPGIVPNLHEHFHPSPKMAEFCNRLIFDEEYLHKRLEVCRAIRVVELKNYPWHYGKMILELLALKKLSKFPAFVRWYLRRHGQEVNNAY